MFARSWATVGFEPVFIILMLSALGWDLKERRIPNALVVVTTVLGITYALITLGTARGALAAVEGVAVGLALWLPWWWFGLIGAGDVKFFAAAAAWLGPRGAVSAAVITALLGGLLGATWLLARAVVLRRASASTAVANEAEGVGHAAVTLPYGVPMALGLGIAAWITLIR